MALEIIHERGPEALTFQSLSEACGLSAPTLVQRFETKAKLKQAALLLAWDRLGERTEQLSAKMPKTPEGAIRMLAAMSKSYGGIDAYAEGLLVLREDMRDPVLRARGAKWKAALTAALDACFAVEPSAPKGVGLLVASQWQGLLLWWAFEPTSPLDKFVERGLKRFVDTLLRWPA